MTAPQSTAPADLVHGSFSDDPPWIVDPEAMPWRTEAHAARIAAAHELPSLIAPRRVPPIGRLLRVGSRIGWSLAAWALTDRRKGYSESRAAISHRLRVDAEKLGPTFIKLGQIISAGVGVFPAELTDEFAKCRDQVAPESPDAVRSIITADLGGPIGSHFRSFDPTPLAAASIAQVHAAELLDATPVVVKVQRPDIGERVRADLAVMATVAPPLIGRIPVTALANPPALVEVFAETIIEELDFRIEAENMLDIARILAELDARDYVVPRPHPTLVTQRVLVMERLSGYRFDDAVGIAGAGLDTHAIVRTGMIGFFEGCLLHGVFHGDLHGGNLFVRDDGRTALLDFGIVGRMSDIERRAFLRLMICGTMNDIRGQLEALCQLGALPLDTDVDQVIADLGLDGPQIDPTTLSQEELLAELQRVLKAMLGYGARLPKSLLLFVKNMIFLDGAIATLAPDLDLLAEISHIAMHFATRHGETLAAEAGMDPRAYEVDLSGVKDAFGIERERGTFTYAELQARRKLIRERLRK